VWEKTCHDLEGPQSAIDVADLAEHSSFFQCVAEWKTPRGVCWLEVRCAKDRNSLTFNLPFVSRGVQAAIQFAYDHTFQVMRSTCLFPPKLVQSREFLWKSIRTGEEFYSIKGLHMYLDGVKHSAKQNLTRK
jgi:hypothetical protein